MFAQELNTEGAAVDVAISSKKDYFEFIEWPSLARVSTRPKQYKLYAAQK